MYAERGTADCASAATKRRTMIAVRQSAQDKKRNGGKERKREKDSEQDGASNE